MKLPPLLQRIFGKKTSPAPKRSRREIRFCLPKNEVSGLKGEFLRAFLTQGKRDVFVETGTYMGRTTQLAAGLFQEVHTIELSSELHASATELFATSKHVTCHGGDSASVLPTILAPLRTRTVFFWLDGHYSGGVTAQGDVVTPILAELDAIRVAGLTHWIIAVDDLRIFRGGIKTSDVAFNGYPTALELATQLRSIDSAAQLGVWGDTMVACSSKLPCVFHPVAVELLKSRLHDESDPAAMHLLDAAIEGEQQLRKVDADTLGKLEELAASYVHSEEFGLGGHYHLWVGLARLGLKNAEGAAESFRRALALDVKHWRVRCYLAEALQQAGRSEEALTCMEALSQVPDEVHALLAETRSRLLKRSYS